MEQIEMKLLVIHRIFVHITLQVRVSCETSTNQYEFPLYLSFYENKFKKELNYI